jgi:Rha family phage regulatory protein
MSEKETLTMAQAIKATGLSRSTITRALKRDDGSFPKPVRNGERGNMHFDREEVLALVAARKRVTELVKSFGVPDDFMDAVRQVDDQAMTDSLQVARRYKKAHKNVLQSFDKLVAEIEDEEFSRLNFQPSEYVDERGKTQRMVRMTKNGFIVLIGSFTGKPARSIMVKYVKCFDAMARYIIALESGILMAGDADTINKLVDLRKRASHHASGLATLGHEIRRCEATEGGIVARVAQTAQDTRQIVFPFADPNQEPAQ